jgi:hypothetical protein
MPQQFAPQDMEQFLSSPAGGSTPPALAHTIAGNVAQHPEGNPYTKMYQQHQQQAAHPPEAKAKAQAYVQSLMSMIGKGDADGG